MLLSELKVCHTIPLMRGSVYVYFHREEYKLESVGDKEEFWVYANHTNIKITNTNTGQTTNFIPWGGKGFVIIKELVTFIKDFHYNKEMK